ncbi:MULTISPECIES: DUF1643 domain-containing protein [Streptococcus]|uniref:DUF1643 domain-containing protein n=1 Tax=Streptococcus TaxID=1301 RepID=UPI00208EE991|nr:DUF1643 domain-containing protein [Streptococcus infantarius]MCO4470957.1 hypothetical protein [Streptococcus infantarius subsp. infantarius]MCO4474621.1 hypothetical protein [Streptococcus infantarius subsp. infantarius]MCO4476574.1 hypothetical protein [Streptococcus infantarius subsp. infantarius]MCO4478646.1 hypothetical protein [Streptococcus infantarius subsp. infantarius]MCO4496599.1 hypothetical protein [Streptococcus infantarius subsp. infantarius]
MKKEAILSEDRKYRYILSRIWDEAKPTVLFIGLNPSTADETTDDPTIRRCINFAKSWGYGGILVANLFAFRSTNPQRLYTEQDPVGSANDFYIKEYSDKSKLTIACWGNHGNFINRSEEVCKLVNSLYCLDINKSGEPKHPLYVKHNITPKPYTR